MLKCSRIDSSLLGLLSKNVHASHEEKVIQNFCQKNSIREKNTYQFYTSSQQKLTPQIPKGQQEFKKMDS